MDIERNGSLPYRLARRLRHANTKSHSVNSGYHAKGLVDGINVGLTGTWFQDRLNHEGIYIDSWLTYSWFDNKIKGETLRTEKYHSKGLSASVESGYTAKLSDSKTASGTDVSWYLQPQAPDNLVRSKN